jgi:uncharacterized protein YndB with AHSA1/START domain
MTTNSGSTLPPVRRTISVSWDPEAAFRRFTEDFGAWWPSATHSIGGARVQRIGFECRAGGAIVEELKDGRRFQWGKVTLWEPPRRVAFTWHPSREETEAQDVEVRFVPEGTGGSAGERAPRAGATRSDGVRSSTPTPGGGARPSCCSRSCPARSACS